MKKLMFALVAAGAAAVMADGAVESQNVVGYTQSQGNPVAGSYQMVAVSFQDCGATTLDVGTIVTSATAKQYSARTTAPQLLIWDPEYGGGIGRYLTYYYLTDAIDADDNEVTAWANAGGDAVSSITIPLGSALWFYCPQESGKTVTIAGQVSNEDDLTVSATVAGYTMIANPFPVSTDVNAVDWFAANGTSSLQPGTYATRSTAAPQILVWDAEFGGGIGRYLTYYYISDAIDADDNEITAWADAGGDVVDDEIPAGLGFWLYLPSGYTGAKATFTK